MEVSLANASARKRNPYSTPLLHVNAFLLLYPEQPLKGQVVLIFFKKKLLGISDTSKLMFLNG